MKRYLKELISIVASLIFLLLGTWCDLATVPMAGAVSVATITFGGWFRVGVVSVLLVASLVGVISKRRCLSLVSVSIALGFFTEMLLSGVYWYQEKTSLMAEMAGASSLQKAIEFGAGGPFIVAAWVLSIVSLVFLCLRPQN